MQRKDFQPLRECPFCGGEAELHDGVVIIPVIDENGAYIDADVEDTPAWVECAACGAATDGVDSADEAIAAWNRRAQESELPANDALTRDELYYLDGEPLYVMDGEGHECYCVVNTKNEDCIDNEAGAWCFEFYDMTGDGKHGLHKMGWRAYRTKPERSEG